MGGAGRAPDASEFCHAWLTIQCEQIAGRRVGLLLLDDGEGHFSNVAVWPDNRRDLSYLSGTAQQALTRKTSFIDQVASPAPGDRRHANWSAGSKRPADSSALLSSN